jgi:hypothetical protein
MDFRLRGSRKEGICIVDLFFIFLNQGWWPCRGAGYFGLLLYLICHLAPIPRSSWWCKRAEWGFVNGTQRRKRPQFRLISNKALLLWTTITKWRGWLDGWWRSLADAFTNCLVDRCRRLLALFFLILVFFFIRLERHKGALGLYVGLWVVMVPL